MWISFSSDERYQKSQCFFAKKNIFETNVCVESLLSLHMLGRRAIWILNVQAHAKCFNCGECILKYVLWGAHACFSMKKGQISGQSFGLQNFKFINIWTRKAILPNSLIGLNSNTIQLIKIKINFNVLTRKTNLKVDLISVAF